TGSAIFSETPPIVHAASTSHQPTPFDERNLKQAQDSIDNSLFDFPIGNLLDDDEIQSAKRETASSDQASRTDASTLPQDVKERLTDLKVLLEQDIGTLVQNSDSVRSVFRLLKDHLQPNAQAILIPAAYIESNQATYNQAR
ncbi:unnamed protein product, partial [Urochloa humidicola]